MAMIAHLRANKYSLQNSMTISQVKEKFFFSGPSNSKVSNLIMTVQKIKLLQAATLLFLIYSICNIWRYHTMVEPFKLNFRVFTVKFLGV